MRARFLLLISTSFFVLELSEWKKNFLKNSENISEIDVELLAEENLAEIFCSHETKNENQEKLDESSSGDDFRDVSSDFNDEDLSFDDTEETFENFDLINETTKNLAATIEETEESRKGSKPVVYGDDYSINTKSQPFAIAFLDFLQYRVEKQRNSERFQILLSLDKKRKENRTRNNKNKT